MAGTKAPPTERYEVTQHRRAQSAQPPAFPGCKPVRLPRAEIDRFEGRLEYWDLATESAWICEPTTPYHERPSRAAARHAGRRVVYLHPAPAKPGPAAMVVGEDDFPDVVLEVDHTTEVRRGKLALSEDWGFPEVWVEVQDTLSPRRARGRRPGLTIHLLEHGRFRVAAESRAFPGWRADEIHVALNEPAPSARTSAVVERVGAALGAREGTGPDDDPLLRSQRRQGFEKGRAEGRAAGRAEARAQMVRQILRSRGLEVSARFSAATEAFAEAFEERCWRGAWLRG